MRKKLEIVESNKKCQRRTKYFEPKIFIWRWKISESNFQSSKKSSKTMKNVKKRNRKNVSKPEVTFVSRSRFVFLDVIVAIQISDWTDVGRVSSSDENENEMTADCAVLQHARKKATTFVSNDGRGTCCRKWFFRDDVTRMTTNQSFLLPWCKNISYPHLTLPPTS